MALVSRASTIGGAVGLFRHSFALTRALSSSSADAGATGEKNPKRRAKKNLFDVAQFLPNWGIGYQMAKSHWRDVSYELTKINLYKDGRHGKAWGIRYKAGLKVADAPVKMSGVNKHGWRYIGESKKNANAMTVPATETTTVTSGESLA